MQRAIDSVLNQTSPPLETIVIDDGSSDGSYNELALKYGDSISLIQNRENKGVSYSRNQGVNAAQGQWIAFLDSDDVWDRHKLEKQIEFHQENPHLRISQCEEIWIRNGKRVNPKHKHAKKSGQIFKDSLPLCIISPSAVIMEKRLFNEVGQFDEALPACEDYDLWLRITQKEEVGLLNEPLITRYAGHEDQLSSKHWGMDRFRVYAMEKHLGADLPHDWKQALHQEYIQKCKVLILGAEKRGNTEMVAFYNEKLSLIET